MVYLQVHQSLKKNGIMYNEDREKIMKSLYQDQHNKRKVPKLKGEIIGYKSSKNYSTWKACANTAIKHAANLCKELNKKSNEKNQTH